MLLACFFLASYKIHFKKLLGLYYFLLLGPCNVFSMWVYGSVLSAPIGLEVIVPRERSGQSRAVHSMHYQFKLQSIVSTVVLHVRGNEA